MNQVSDLRHWSHGIPGIWVTLLPLQRRGHALEGVSRHGRAAPICRPPTRGREDGAARTCPRTRDQGAADATVDAADRNRDSANRGVGASQDNWDYAADICCRRPELYARRPAKDIRRTFSCAMQRNVPRLDRRAKRDMKSGSVI